MQPSGNLFSDESQHEMLPPANSVSQESLPGHSRGKELDGLTAACMKGSYVDGRVSARLVGVGGAAQSHQSAQSPEDEPTMEVGAGVQATRTQALQVIDSVPSCACLNFCIRILQPWIACCHDCDLD